MALPTNAVDAMKVALDAWGVKIENGNFVLPDGRRVVSRWEENGIDLSRPMIEMSLGTVVSSAILVEVMRALYPQ
jgi:hypothetical protein